MTTTSLKARLVAIATAVALIPTAIVATEVPAQAATAKPARLKALTYAKKQLGDPYRFGGAGPNAWDCSGLVMRSYAVAGKKSIGGHSATAQYVSARSKGRLHLYKNKKAGDILFYKSGSSVYHVAIHAGGGKMVEAPKPGTPVRVVKVRTSQLSVYVARP